MTPRSTNLVKTPPKNCTEMSKKPFDSSTETMDLPDYIGGANTTTTNCSPQVTHAPAPRFYGLPKIHKANGPM